MKNFVRKIAAVSAGVVMLGTTLGAAVAADLSDLPEPMVVSGAYVNTAMVIGSTEDSAARTTLKTYFDGLVTSTDISGGEGVTEEEIVLNGDVVSGSISASLTDSKVPGLVDDSIVWDNGQGSKSYNVHEEINITDGQSGLKLKTTYDDNKLENELGSPVVITAGQSDIAYYYVFEENLNSSYTGTPCAAVASADADTLTLTILGKDYEVSNCDADSITVTLAAKRAMSIGEAYTDPESGKIVTLNDVFSDSVEVDVSGEVEVIDDNSTEKVNGVRVKVESVGYHSTTPETSKAILRIGEDITKTYDDGDEFVGEDEDDPEWTWAITNPLVANGYVGVKYGWTSSGATSEHPPVGIGESYVLPNDFAAVKFDKLTDVNYEDIAVTFEELDLYNATGNSVVVSGGKVVQLKGESDDVFVTTTGSHETDTLYLYYNVTGNNTVLYYKDIDEDQTPANRARPVETKALSVGVTSFDLADIESGDSDFTLKWVTGENISYGNLTIDDTLNVTSIAMGGAAITLGTTGAFARLGATADADDSGDIAVNNVSIAGNDYDTLLPWGVTITTPEGGADADEVIMTIPDDQVYAQVSVLAGVDAGAVEADLITHTEDTTEYDNLVLVGGPCVNSLTAEFMGKTFPACGTASGIAQDTAVVKLVELDDQTALIVAGWEKADTARAATEVAAGDLTGESMIV